MMFRILFVFLLAGTTAKCTTKGCYHDNGVEFTVELNQKQSDTQLTDYFTIKHDSKDIESSSVAVFFLSHDNTWQRTPAVLYKMASNWMIFKKDLIGKEMVPSKGSCDNKYSKEDTVFWNKDLKIDQGISLCYLVTVTNGKHSAAKVVPDGCNMKIAEEKPIKEGELVHMEKSGISKRSSDTFHLSIHNFQTIPFHGVLRAFICKVVVKQYGSPVDLSTSKLGEQVKLWYQTTNGWIELWGLNHNSYNSPRNIYTSVVTILSVPNNCHLFKCVASVNGHEQHSRPQPC